MSLANIIFIVILTFALSLFIINLKKIINNIKLGKDVNRSDNKKIRLKNMIRVALGQSKMFDRPTAAVLHLFFICRVCNY